MTEDKRLLGIRAAKLFTPKPWKHLNLRKPADERGFYNYDCPKCGNDLRGFKNWGKDDPCQFPDPIEINWDNAMRLFRDTGMIWERLMYQLEVIFDEGDFVMNADFRFWLIGEVQPEHYILAACQARERE